MKKANSYLSGKAPPVVHKWTDEDKQQLIRIKNREIDMLETYLGSILHFRRGMQLLPFLILPTRNGIH